MRQRHQMQSRAYQLTTRHPFRLLLTLIVFVVMVCLTMTALRIRTERQTIKQIVMRHNNEIHASHFYRYVGVDWRDMSSAEASYRHHASSLLPYVGNAGGEVLFPVIAIYLCKIQMTDADIRALSRLPCVESINLSGMQLTRGQFELLSEIDSLRHIQLYDANVSEIDVQRFRELRPDVRIEW